MALRLTTNHQIDRYLAAVDHAAIHHAPIVRQAVKRLAKAVRGRLNLANDSVEVYLRLGNRGRTCWVTIGGRKCAFSYDYSLGTIVIKDGSTQGPVLFGCNNRTPQSTVSGAIAAIWP